MNSAPRRAWVVNRVRTFRQEMGWDEAGPAPVDALCERYGVALRWGPESEMGRDGAWTAPCSSGYLTVLNPRFRDFQGRLRWTKSHELMHAVVLGHLAEYSVSNVTHAQERVLCREADIGAAELLLPEAGLRAVIRRELCDAANNGLLPHEIGKLKGCFGVSWEALFLRLDELNIQSRRVSSALFRIYEDSSFRGDAAWVIARAWKIIGARDPEWLDSNVASANISANNDWLAAYREDPALRLDFPPRWNPPRSRRA